MSAIVPIAEGDYAISACLLGLIESAIGFVDQVFRKPWRASRKRGHTKAYRQTLIERRTSVRDRQFQNTGSHLLSDRYRRICRRVGQDDRELFASITGDQHPRSGEKSPPQSANHFDQTLVAALMAVKIVDVFEVVDIDHQ